MSQSRTIAANLTITGTIECDNLTTCDNLLSTSSIKIKRVSVSQNYTVLTTDFLVAVDTTNQSVTITLPDASTIDKHVIYIKDEGGYCSTNNITITTTNSQLIDGQQSITMNVNYSSITLYNNGINKYFII